MRGARCLVWALLLAAPPARGAVIDAPDVVLGGESYRAFVDTSTGRTWLDLDEFWDVEDTYASLTALLAGSGFHLATLPELLALQASLPADSGDFASEVLVVGGNYIGNPHPGDDRPLMWGVYEDGDASDGVSWSWRRPTETSWGFTANPVGVHDPLPLYEPFHQDLGAWVVTDVPEPGAAPLLGLVLAALALSARSATARSGAPRAAACRRRAAARSGR